MTPSFTIELSEDEQALLDQIEFNVLALEGHLEVRRNAELAKALTEALSARDAIPEARRRYFVDPAFNIGGRGSSKQQIFERNGCRGDDILKHPHFLPYLRYFIYGADLPKPVQGAFRAAVEDCGMVTSGDIGPLGKKARALTRQHGLEARKAREEFFKLALDCGLEPSTASFIREAVGTAR